ncbi:MAG: hypothetical protein ABSB32_13450 [Thermodesulfobacteriota bacterium]|jgi:hypothetical protein
MKISIFKTPFLITLLLLCPAMGIAQQKTIEMYDGSDWENWSATHKLYFIEGFLSGAHYIIDFHMGHTHYAGDKFTPQKGFEFYLSTIGEEKKTFTREEMELLMEYAAYEEKSDLGKYYVADITLGQIVDGLNTFYGDFKNRRIRISDAVYVVKKQIQGASSEEIEVLCQWLRSDRDAKKQFYKDKDGKMRYIPFP